MPTGFDVDYKLSEEEYAEVDYLKDCQSVTGYRNVIPYRRRFRATWQDAGRKYNSPSYGTIEECVWWFHKNKAVERGISTEKYPEYYLPPQSHVKLDEITYLLNKSTKAGYRNVIKSKGSFWAVIKQNGHCLYFGPHKTPADAAWDRHTRAPYTAKPTVQPIVKYVQPPIDYDALEKYINPDRKLGFNHVWYCTFTKTYCGVYFKDDVKKHTKHFKTIEEALWELELTCRTLAVSLTKPKRKSIKYFDRRRAELLGMLVCL
jgi:hypothetical protein